MDGTHNGTEEWDTHHTIGHPKDGHMPYTFGSTTSYRFKYSWPSLFATCFFGSFTMLACSLRDFHLCQAHAIFRRFCKTIPLAFCQPQRIMDGYEDTYLRDLHPSCLTHIIVSPLSALFPLYQPAPKSCRKPAARNGHMCAVHGRAKATGGGEGEVQGLAPDLCGNRACAYAPRGPRLSFQRRFNGTFNSDRLPGPWTDRCKWRSAASNTSTGRPNTANRRVNAAAKTSGASCASSLASADWESSPCRSFYP